VSIVCLLPIHTDVWNKPSVSTFHPENRGRKSDFRLPVRSGLKTELLWVIMHRVVVIFLTDVSEQTIGPYSRVNNLRTVEFLPLQTEPMGNPETSVWNYHYTLRNSPEEHSYRECGRFLQK
jgi:hypothetical protein